MKLCCIFNYAPLYRESIFRKIDEEFDTQFFFADTVSYGKTCDIKKVDYSIFKKIPKKIENRSVLRRMWTKGIQSLPFKDYNVFLITEGNDWSKVLFLISCKLLHKPVYIWGHGNKKWNWKTFGSDRLMAKLCTGFLTYGEGGRKRLSELGMPLKKIEVIYNSLCDRVDPECLKTFQSDEISKHFSNNYPTLIFVGRLTKVKKLSWLIDAIKKHNEQGVLYNILFVGDGTERQALEEMVARTNLSKRVWFYGECYDETKLNRLIYNSTLCVSPGNVGLTALHAMMYGTPVLSHDDFETQMPEYETITEGVTGLLYKNGDFEDFCDKISYWLNSTIDRECTRQSCYNMINGKWNSICQINILKNLFWGK